MRRLVTLGKKSMTKVELLLAISKIQLQIRQPLMGLAGYANQGDPAVAIALCEQLVPLLKQNLSLEELNNQEYPDTPMDVRPTAQTLSNTMFIQADKVETYSREQAEKTRAEAIQICQNYLSKSEATLAQLNRIGSLQRLGQFNEALTILAKTRDELLRLNDPLNVAKATISLVDMLQWLGDYDRALAEIIRAQEFVKPFISGEQISSQNEQNALLGAIAGVTAEFGNAATPASFTAKVKEAELRAKLWQVAFSLEFSHAIINRYLGNYAEAKQQLNSILSQTPGEGKIGIQYQLAAISISETNYEEGLKYISLLEPLMLGDLRPKLGGLLSLKAEALLGLGRTDEALIVLNQAVQDLVSFSEPDSLWRAHWRRARVLEALGQTDQAIESYLLAANTINRLRKAPLGYRLDSTYLKDKFQVFEDAIALCCDQGKAETCCSLMEMIKSRALTATLSVPLSDQHPTANDLDKQFDSLSSQIDATEYAIYSGGQTSEMMKKRELLLSEREKLLEETRFSDPRWRSVSEPVPFDLSKTLSLLSQRHQAALSLFYKAGQVIAVLLKDQKCEVDSIQLTPQTCSALASYEENLQSDKPNLKWFDPSASLNLSADQLIPSRLLNAALNADSLVVVPHGSLHLLPWAGLAFGDKRLFEYCPASIIPNLSCLLMLDSTLSSSPRVAIIGAPDYSALRSLKPLDLAPEELATIREIYPSPPGIIADVMQGKDATETNFWQLIKNENSPGNILHVACHGTFVTGDPMNSALLLTSSKVDAAEISRSKIHYDEIILSACSTGYRPTTVQGVPLTGDDILGLPGAFLEAGARSILVSIPKAREDVTLEFMTIYHENRAKGLSPVHSLQQTQKIMLSSSMSKPFLWIGFTLYGCQ
jgi:CHAT domain-containing protein